MLSDLHWPKVSEGLTFKIVLTVFKCLHGLASYYLSSHGVLVADAPGRRPGLRSQFSNKLVVPRSFSVYVCGKAVFLVAPNI